MKNPILLLPLLLWMCNLGAQTLNPRPLTPNGPIYEMASSGDTVYAVGFISRVGYETGGAALFADTLPNTLFPIIDGEVHAIVSDGGGGWYLGGSFSQVDTISRTNLVHVFANGAVDLNFNFPVNNEVSALALAGNELYLGGKFTQVDNQPRNYLARISLSLGGTFLNGWAPNPNNYVTALTASANDLFVGGSFTVISAVNQPAFASYNLTTGTLQQSLTPGTGQVSAMDLDGNRLFVGGTFLGSTGFYTGKATVLTGNNTKPDFAFPRFGGNVYAMVPDGSGGWYVGGAFTQVNGTASGRLVHVLANNTLDAGFSPAPSGTVFALHLRADTLYVGGTFATIAAQPRANLAAIKTTTSALLAWQPDPNGKVATIHSDNSRVFIGGAFTRVSGELHPRFAALNKTTAVPANTVVPASGEVNALLTTPLLGGHLFAGGSFNGNVGFPAGNIAVLSALSETSAPKLPDFNGDLYAAVPDGAGGWYVAGAFSTSSGLAVPRIAHILPDSTLDAAFSFTLNNGVYALSLSGNTLYLGGIFTAINGSTRNRLAALDVVSKTLLPWDPNAGGQVNALVQDGGVVYVAGAFTTLGGQTRNRLAAVDAASGTVLSWNPDANQAMNALAVSGSWVYAGGNFTTLGGTAFNRLVRIDKTSGLPDTWNPNVTGSVNTMLIGTANNLYFGGTFTLVGGINRNRLAEVDLTTGALNAFNPNMNGEVESLALMGGLLYAGGSFTQVGGQTLGRLVAINPATSLPGTWSPNPDNTVRCLSVNGSRILAGGAFDVLKTQTRTRLLDYQSATLALLPWAPNINNEVNALSLYQSELVAGGLFTQAEGQTRNRLASWDLGSQTLTSLNPGADDQVNALAVRNDTLFAGGQFLNLATASRNRLGAISLTTGGLLAWDPNAENEVLSLTASGNALAIGGSFNSFNSQTRNRLFCLDILADTLTAWAPDLPGILFGPRINAVAVSGDSVWVGGQFSALSSAPRKNLAVTDAATGQVLPLIADADGEIFALEVNGDDLWIGGQTLDSINNITRGNIAVIDRLTAAVRNFDPSTNSYVFAIAAHSGEVVIGGNFEQAMSQTRQGGFAIESSTGRLLPWNPGLGPNSQITSIALDPEHGHAYIGGFFSELHGQNRQNLARINLTDGQPDNWQADANQSVNHLIWESAGQQLIAGGDFTTLGGQPRNYLGALDGNGQVLPFNPAPDLNISDLALLDSTLYISGTFSTLGGQTRNRLGAVDLNGQVLPWAPRATNFSGSPGFVNTLEIGANRLYIGGFFTQVDSQTRYRVAAFDLNSGDLLPWSPAVDSQFGSNLRRVSNIREFNNNLFLTGAITDVEGTTVSGIAWMDPFSGLVKGLRIFPNGFINDVLALDSLLYIAGDFTSIDQKTQINLASFTFPNDFFASGYSDIIPKQGGNTGDLTATVYGSGFQAGVKVLLTKAGLPDIVAFDSLTEVVSGVQLRATFNLRNQTPGFRDVVLVAGGDTTVIPDGFEVLQGGETAVWADVIIPGSMRVAFPGRAIEFPIVVNYGNEGTVDGEGVPIWLALDTTLRVIRFEFNWIPQGPGDKSPADSNLYSVQVDSVFNEAFGANLYVLVIPRIPAGSQGSLVLYVEPLQEGDISVAAWATEPMYGSPLKYAVGECMDLIIGKITGVIPGGGCIYNAMDALLSPMFDAGYDPANFATASWFSSYSITLANAVVECGILATGGGLVLDMMAELLKLPNTINDLNTLFTQCIPFHPNPSPNPNRSNVGVASDPNQKTGPGGAGEQRWISEVSRMPYLVEFENVDSATAPALRVVILDTLDSEVYDLETLQLNFFTIADSLFPIPAGQKSWTAWVDLRPRVSSLVRMEAGLTGNVLRWEFESLDPTTLALQSGALEGFLPPNVNDPEGRGAVSFTLRRKSNLPTLTPFENRAAIYFDGNAPIITNTWINTLDVDSPESAVSALDSVQATTSIPLSWTGSDLGSGVRYYQLWVSVNGAPFRPALEFIRDTSLIFPGDWGYSYAFYTLAVDSAGNVEAAPDTPDATTRVDGNIANDPQQNLRFALFPNPNNGKFTLAVTTSLGQHATWEVMDLAGRVLLHEALSLDAGENNRQVDLPLPDGLYLGTLRTADGVATVRFAVVK